MAFFGVHRRCSWGVCCIEGTRRTCRPCIPVWNLRVQHQSGAAVALSHPDVCTLGCAIGLVCFGGGSEGNKRLQCWQVVLVLDPPHSTHLQHHDPTNTPADPRCAVPTVQCFRTASGLPSSSSPSPSPSPSLPSALSLQQAVAPGREVFASDEHRIASDHS